MMRVRSRQAARGAQAPDRIDTALVGKVVSFRNGDVEVDFAGNTQGPVVARISAALDDSALERAARDQQEALLFFEGGDPSRPVLTALLRSESHRLEAFLDAAPAAEQQRVARVDGKQVIIEGRDEVVLRCGKASLTLRKDGKVVLRGVNLVTQAEQVHKVRGGKVQIN